jgi:hypothetical protein
MENFSHLILPLTKCQKTVKTLPFYLIGVHPDYQKQSKGAMPLFSKNTTPHLLKEEFKL